MTIQNCCEMDKDIEEVLFSQQQLHQKVQEMGEVISRDYAGKNLLMVSVLKGSVLFMGKDLRRG